MGYIYVIKYSKNNFKDVYVGQTQGQWTTEFSSKPTRLFQHVKAAYNITNTQNNDKTGGSILINKYGTSNLYYNVYDAATNYGLGNSLQTFKTFLIQQGWTLPTGFDLDFAEILWIIYYKSQNTAQNMNTQLTNFLIGGEFKQNTGLQYDPTKSTWWKQLASKYSKISSTINTGSYQLNRWTRLDAWHKLLFPHFYIISRIYADVVNNIIYTNWSSIKNAIIVGFQNHELTRRNAAEKIALYVNNSISAQLQKETNFIVDIINKSFNTTSTNKTNAMKFIENLELVVDNIIDQIIDVLHSQIMRIFTSGTNKITLIGGDLRKTKSQQTIPNYITKTFYIKHTNLVILTLNNLQPPESWTDIWKNININHSQIDATSDKRTDVKEYVYHLFEQEIKKYVTVPIKPKPWLITKMKNFITNFNSNSSTVKYWIPFYRMCMSYYIGQHTPLVQLEILNGASIVGRNGDSQIYLWPDYIWNNYKKYANSTSIDILNWNYF